VQTIILYKRKRELHLFQF